MKVLQILPSLEVGGVERGVIDLARAMKRRGEEMVVISSGGPLVQELQKIGVPHYALPVQQKSLFSLFLVSHAIGLAYGTSTPRFCQVCGSFVVFCE